MWNQVECNGSAGEDCLCQRLRGATGRSHGDSETAPRVSLPYQSSATILLQLLLTILSVSSVLAAPQTSCIMCDKEDIRPRVPPYSDSYEEFTFDHQVSQHDAMEALRKFNETLGLKNACNTIKCDPNVLKYCLGNQFINDHCWCELQHREEGLPFVPHICYADEKVHRPSIGSCFLFDEVKECCCAPAWAKKWRHISGSSRSQNPPKILVTMLFVFSLLHWMGRRGPTC
ncbi:uncharacterized protein [Drosophila pseudoobscura]|uniref:CCC domain-containing protein n=1 Tax=Drosophila pseudoobscura pseudoobscura TaxID=46245 RepID=A0A6I8VM14_DROPS|nr:uncharacterized protein LOC4812261 [Drosophila pseudoobscura]XP_015044061.2 uncharacterized protein LOC4812261 [Drosophila pseudoobscura]XP_033239879.1 uncharacterized protein LOC4812261 [Drosophila pseudoobscura]